MTGADASARFVREAHHQVRDLLVARPRRYWCDFLLTMLVAYAAFALYISAPDWSLSQAGGLVVCGLAMFRAVVFTHELAHRRGRAFASFAVCWNVLCGIPFLMPSFLYGDHKGHHSSDVYGTWSDPEYIMHTPTWRWRIAAFLLLPAVYPVLAVVRFVVLTPLALTSRSVDRLVWTCASSLYVMNESYRREYDREASARSRWLQELACCAWGWAIALLVVAGRIDWATIEKTYLVFLFWIVVNQVRTLVAHRYANGTDTPISYVDQLLDTNTFPYGRVLPELWAPVGLRYHALHHLLPTLPYHSMRLAHERLMAKLPAGSPYHRTIKRGLWSALMATLLNRERPAAPRLAESPERQARRRGAG